MFLITTADETYWEIKDKVILLGEWCKIWSKREFWKNTPHTIIPYHWNDRDKLHQDFYCLDKVYERLLQNLAYHLNSLLNVDYSIRYWRIIIGPWLSSFLCMYFDRYESIVGAAKSGKVTNTYISKNQPESFVVEDIPNLIIVRSTDQYNNYLYSQIIQDIKPFHFEYIDVQNERNTKRFYGNKINKLFSFKNFQRKLIELYQNIIPSRLNDIVFVSSYLNPWDLLKLQISLGQLPYIFTPTINSPDLKYNNELRQQINLYNSTNQFEEVLYRNIKHHIPLLYIEGHQDIQSKSLDKFPKKPKVIFNSAAYECDEGFKFWAAYNTEKNGAKLVGTQHGFNYGVQKWFHEEEHQIKIYDKFYTWGWSSKKYKNTKPLPAVKLNHKIKNVKPNKKGKILFATYALPRYAYKMLSVPIGSEQTQKLINSQITTVKRLSKEARKLVLVRPKAVSVYEYGLNQLEQWNTECPDVETYMGTQISLYEQMCESRLLITLISGTTTLEAFAVNFPAVLFWSPFHEIRPEALPYYDALIKVGILHRTPQSLANKINEIYRDPMSWWQQPEIQDAKDMFCTQYARTSDNWRNIWKTELLNLSNGVHK